MRGRPSRRLRSWVFQLLPFVRESLRRPGAGVWSESLENPDIILDGAHNPAAARVLAAYIRKFFADEPVRIIFGAMRDKAVDEVTNTLFPLATEIILTAPNQPRALNPHSLRWWRRLRGL